MSSRIDGYFYLAMTIVLTVYGQIMMKWQVGRVGTVPASMDQKVWFLIGMLLRPWVLSAFAAAFLASLFWMLTLTRLPLGAAYPFMSLAFVGVILLSAVIFGEAVGPIRLVGMLFLIAGISCLSQR